VRKKAAFFGAEISFVSRGDLARSNRGICARTDIVVDRTINVTTSMRLLSTISQPGGRRTMLLSATRLYPGCISGNGFSEAISPKY
jgi:hypothetical protein